MVMKMFNYPCTKKSRSKSIHHKIIRDSTHQTKGPFTKSGSEKKKRSKKKRQVPKNIFVFDSAFASCKWALRFFHTELLAIALPKNG